jgi:hypothetical protein
LAFDVLGDRRDGKLLLEHDAAERRRAHIALAELQRIGLAVAELEREQPHRARREAFGDEARSHPLGDPAIAPDLDVERAPEPGLIGGGVEARFELGAISPLEKLRIACR